MITPVGLRTRIGPQPKDYNKDLTCDYHQGEVGHTVGNCRVLRHRIQDLLDQGVLKFRIEGIINAIGAEKSDEVDITSAKIPWEPFPTSRAQKELAEAGIYKYHPEAQGRNLQSFKEVKKEVTSLIMGGLVKRRREQPEEYCMTFDQLRLSPYERTNFQARMDRIKEDFEEFCEKKKKELGKLSPATSPETSKPRPSSHPIRYQRKDHASDSFSIYDSIFGEILSLLLASESHRKALLKVLNEAYVPEDITGPSFENMVTSILVTNQLTFSVDELPPEGRGHIKALYISVKTNDRIVSKSHTLTDVHPKKHHSTVSSSKLSKAGIMVAREFVKAGFQPGQGLGCANQGRTAIVTLEGNKDGYGLGYTPTRKDRQLAYKARRQKAAAKLRGEKWPEKKMVIPHIRTTFPASAMFQVDEDDVDELALLFTEDLSIDVITTEGDSTAPPIRPDHCKGVDLEDFLDEEDLKGYRIEEETPDEDTEKDTDFPNLLPHWMIPRGLETLEFEMFCEHGDPEFHLRRYHEKMALYTDDELLMISMFHESRYRHNLKSLPPPPGNINTATAEEEHAAPTVEGLKYRCHHHRRGFHHTTDLPLPTGRGSQDVDWCAVATAYLK
uniref:G-patch domain-containing protein n=1 Tax=Fagus sylvatica TaxID=28930 RepID=A0A2N9F0B5_FAGSY